MISAIASILIGLCIGTVLGTLISINNNLSKIIELLEKIKERKD